MKKSYLKKEIQVQPESAGLRLDTFLSQYMSSRAEAEKIIKQAQVKKKVKNKKENEYFSVLKTSHKVKAGECYSFPLKEPAPSPVLKPYDYTIPVLYEDEHLLVVNKPAGIVTHPGPGHEQDTLVNALQGKKQLSIGRGDPLRPGIVHRLDKDVSGLLLLSKKDQASELLIEQFKTRKIKRIYRALVLGKVKQNSQKIISFIGRHSKDRKKFYSFDQEQKGAKKAITYYRVLESFQDIIHHIECELKTGRTHQIRVHLSSMALPILGEELYFSRRRQAKALAGFSFKKNIFSFNRLALYSAFLEFTHPVHGELMSFSLPWPEELCFLIEELCFNPSFLKKT